MKDIFKQHTGELRESLDNMDQFYSQVKQVVKLLVDAFGTGQKVLVAGNGGSAAEAQHLSDEMVGRYKEDRPAYPVIALTADSAILTCIGNDYGYDEVFARQVDALGQEGDIFVGLTTSGTSANILRAAERARERGMTVVAFTGPVGTLKDMADYAVISPTEKASIMQELHLHAIHLICEALEPGALTSLEQEQRFGIGVKKA